MKTRLLCASLLVLVATGASAQSNPTLFPSSGPKTLTKNEQAEKDSKEVLETKKRLDAEKKKEEMRDKTHDNRLKVGKDTSVGVDGKGVNVRKSIP